MTENLHPSLPDYLLPLLEAKTAHESFELSLKMLMEADLESQLKLLQDTDFVKLTQSALNGLDDCKEDHLQSLSNVLDNSNQQAFSEVFK